MAINVLTFTLPTSDEARRSYAEKVPRWIETALSAPGAEQFCAYHSPDEQQAMIEIEYESASAAEMFLSSEIWQNLRSELQELGCGNFQTGTWDTSPLVPEPKYRRTVAGQALADLGCGFRQLREDLLR
jgi:hypothetical protein